MGFVYRACSAVLPVIAAFVLAAALFAVTGYDLYEVTAGVIEGAITGYGSFWSTLRWAMPLLLIALGVMFAFRAAEFNIGGQGQMMMGGLGCVTIALLMPGPVWVVLPLAVLTGMLFGTLWSLLPGVLKIRYGADEVILTLMLNFIAVLFVSWVTTGPLKDPAVRGESASTPKVDDALRLSGGDGMSWALLIMLVIAAVVAWLIAERTKTGLQMRFVGEAEKAARWQGINVDRLKLISYALAGMFAGLAGAFEVLGPNGRLVTGATPTIGFTAIVVAIVGLSRVPGIVFAALLFGGLQSAVLFLPIVSDLPSSGLKILEGIIAILVTAELVRRRRAG